MITTNASKIKRNFQKAIDVQAENLTQALDEIGLRGVEIVKPITPVDTGRLRNSMSYTTNNKVFNQGPDSVRRIRSKTSVAIGTNVIYGPHVEYGNNRSKGFMRRAYLILVPAAKTIFKKVMKV